VRSPDDRRGHGKWVGHTFQGGTNLETDGFKKKDTIDFRQENKNGRHGEPRDAHDKRTICPNLALAQIFGGGRRDDGHISLKSVF